MLSRTLHRDAGALFALGALSAALFAAPAASAAEAWKPSKPVRLLVGFAPGGSADTLARLLAEPLSQRLGQSVVVENLAGAGGNIMAFRLSQLPADGYTIGIGAAGRGIGSAGRKATGMLRKRDSSDSSSDAGDSSSTDED